MRIDPPATPAHKWLTAAALGIALGCMGGASVSEVQAKGVYTVAKVKADATASNAVDAKKEALLLAEQKAIQTVFKRLAPFTAYERLPRVKSSLVQDMLANFSVRREANSATQYLATLDYEFSPRVVREFLGAHQIPFTDSQAPQITVIPVYIEGGAVVAHGRDPWRKAWVEMDLEHALTPIKLGHGTELSRDQVTAILEGDQAAFATLKEKQPGDTLVLAVAERTAQDNRLATRLYGVDAVGAIGLSRIDRVYGGDISAVAARAAKIALAVFEGRWKLTYSVPADEDGVAKLQTVGLTVEFAGLEQWQRIHARLARIPGIQAIEVKSLSARAAAITFRYAGDAQRLASQLAANNLTLQDAGGAWILRSNQ